FPSPKTRQTPLSMPQKQHPKTRNSPFLPQKQKHSYPYPKVKKTSPSCPKSISLPQNKNPLPYPKTTTPLSCSPSLPAIQFPQAVSQGHHCCHPAMPRATREGRKEEWGMFW
uniref:Uncharacterized protein n=1 Tax=Zonotrichia albicollis TaxID=44394 RepID=A0A8D2MQH1_ZONAL